MDECMSVYVCGQTKVNGATRLVDAYCGSGLFAISASSIFDSVVGVEISKSMVKTMIITITTVITIFHHHHHKYNSATTNHLPPSHLH
jgi:16S rRNA G966 N2-methylase RsmD